MRPSCGVDELDRRLLNLLQRDFPLTARPYRDAGTELGLAEREVIGRIVRLKDDGIIRQISAIFDSRALGYRSCLVAAKVPPERADQAAEVISGHPGVSHNYLRTHEYNLWFTITVHSARDLQSEVMNLADRAGAASVLLLPSIRSFKIGVSFDMTGEEDGTGRQFGGRETQSASVKELVREEIWAVRVLQDDLPTLIRPFEALAERVGLTEAALLHTAQDLLARGVMRRFAAVLHHRRAGYTANAMTAWVVPEDKVEEVGPVMASFTAVTHCYQRLTAPDWPYSVFTMIHGRTAEECSAVVEAIARETGITEYALLYSTKEYKKVRVRYFTDDDLALGLPPG
ncbi:MAG: siroheme decarboxylase subunit beta [Armatimonadota bacterium]